MRLHVVFHWVSYGNACRQQACDNVANYRSLAGPSVAKYCVASSLVSSEIGDRFTGILSQNVISQPGQLSLLAGWEISTGYTNMAYFTFAFFLFSV